MNSELRRRLPLLCHGWVPRLSRTLNVPGFLFVTFTLISLALALGANVETQKVRWNRLAMRTVQLYMQHKYAEAIPVAQKTLALAENAFGANSNEVADSLHNLAELYFVQSQYEKAEPLYKSVLSIREKTLPANDPEVAAALDQLALLYYTESRYTDAEPLFERALRIRVRAFPNGDASIASSLEHLARTYRDEGRYGDAELLLRQALSIQEKGPDRN